MQYENFKEITIKKMDFLMNKYYFDVSFTQEGIEFHTDKYTLFFYLENYFEVSIGFRFGEFKEDVLYFDCLADYLGWDSKEIPGNQIGSMKLENYYDKVLPALEFTLSKLQKDIFILEKCCLVFQKNNDEDFTKNQLILLEYSLNELWRNKNYSEFKKKYENALLSFPEIFEQNTLLKKKYQYILKNYN